jgi:hypothetical protein
LHVEIDDGRVVVFIPGSNESSGSVGALVVDANGAVGEAGADHVAGDLVGCYGGDTGCAESADVLLRIS